MADTRESKGGLATTEFSKNQARMVRLAEHLGPSATAYMLNLERSLGLVDGVGFSNLYLISSPKNEAEGLLPLSPVLNGECDDENRGMLDSVYTALLTDQYVGDIPDLGSDYVERRSPLGLKLFEVFEPGLGPNGEFSVIVVNYRFS